MGSSNNLEAALQQAAEGTSDSTTDVGKEAEAQTSEESTGTPKSAEAKVEAGKKEPQTVPYARVKELSDKANTLTSLLEERDAKLAEKDSELGKLVDLLDSREYDSKVVEKINELHGDARYTDIIDQLDKAVRGVDEEEAKGNLTSEEASERTSKALKAATSELEEQLGQQRDDIILDRAERLTEKYMDELPESYNDEDLKVIGEALIDRIDWNQVHEDPDSLPDVLAQGFQKTVDWYGVPKGSLVAASQEGANTEEASQADPAAALEKRLDETEWGKLQMVKTPQGDVLQPVVSDEDWVDSLADAIAAAQGRPRVR
jgi:hypothetical protein